MQHDLLWGDSRYVFTRHKTWYGHVWHAYCQGKGLKVYIEGSLMDKFEERLAEDILRIHLQGQRYTQGKVRAALGL